MDGGPCFVAPVFAAAVREAGSRMRPSSGKGGSASLRVFGEEDADREDGGTRWFPLGDV